MNKFSSFFLFSILIIPYFSFANNVNITGTSPSLVVPIGVVLDLNSPLGSMADSCMRMAVSDFYEAHPNYKTRLKLHTRSADSVLDANFAAVELVKREEVDGIIGPQGSAEETFIAELGQKVHIPVISFTATSSAPPYKEKNSYFLRATPDDAVQAQALAAICRVFKWPQVAVLHEDSENGHKFISHLKTAFQEVNIGLAYMVAVPSSANNSQISEELNKLATKQTRVFVVHMSPSLGYRLFSLAEKARVMSEGYAWLVSYSLSIFLNSIDPGTHDSMEGVIGIRPYVSRSKNLESFQDRWKRNVKPVKELNVYGLWAYDAVTALAMAVEKVVVSENSTSFVVNNTINGTNESFLRISTFGPRILDVLPGIKFEGLSGEFELDEGKLKPSAVEIFNRIGTGEKTVGFWTREGGLIRSLGETRSAKELKSIMWPGDSVTLPRGWAIPAPSSGKLRVGVPWKLGYTEFVDVVSCNATDHPNVTGFSIDIFKATLQILPFPIEYEFYFYNDTENINWSYDDMLRKIPKDYDMVVGDTTIWAPRANGVDFSIPYSESGVILVVKNRKPFDMWIFIKPLRWDLWLAIFVACILMGIVLRVLESRVTSNDIDTITAHKKRPGLIHLSPVAVLAFPERNMVSNNWSFIVLVLWLFMAFILMQSYTANLSAILTVDQLKFAFSDNYYVGYQEGSFMKDFLTKHLDISISRLRNYTSVEDYHKGMSKGSKNGGIDAIFDEIPYMKLFLKKYDSQYKMVGPTYRTGGFGFAFPLESELVSHFSKAILVVTQGTNMTFIEQKNFGPGYSSQDPLSSTISQGTSSLSFHDFAGLFIIVGSVTVIALFCSATPIGRMLTERTAHFINVYFFFKTPRVNSMDDSSAGGNSENGSGQEPIVDNTISSPSHAQGSDIADVVDQVPGHDQVEIHETSGPSTQTCADQNLGMRVDQVHL